MAGRSSARGPVCVGSEHRLLVPGRKPPGEEGWWLGAGDGCAGRSGWPQMPYLAEAEAGGSADGCTQG